MTESLPREDLAGAFPAGASATMRFTLDEPAAGLTTALETLILTLFTARSGLALGDTATGRSILNQNGGTVYDTPQTDTLADGTTVTYTVKVALSADDMAALGEEVHVARIAWTWAGGSAWREYAFLVVPPATVTAPPA